MLICAQKWIFLPMTGNVCHLWLTISFCLPLTGVLTECYDELGNRYQLPVYCLAPPINMIEEKSDLETLDIPEPSPNTGQECQLRLRLSTGKDLKLLVRSTDTVYHMKRRLHTTEGVEPSSQRWFFSGRPLTDKMKLEELKIPKDYVVQVIISQPLQTPTPVENWLLLNLFRLLFLSTQELSLNVTCSPIRDEDFQNGVPIPAVLLKCWAQQFIPRKQLRRGSSSFISFQDLFSYEKTLLMHIQPR